MRAHLQHRSRTPADEHASAAHISMNRQHAPTPVDKDHVDRKAHAERMHGIARFEPQHAIRIEANAPKQSTHPLDCPVRDFDCDTSQLATMNQTRTPHSNPSCMNFIAIGNRGLMSALQRASDAQEPVDSVLIDGLVERMKAQMTELDGHGARRRSGP
jgi:hypothetical protein